MDKILDRIKKPQDLRIIRKDLLPKLIEEIRQEIIETVSKTGGHLASSLGCVELITALHYVFDVAPGKDRIIYDVGHQTYAHKLLTGRKERFHTLRQFGGLSGFPSRDESEYDFFGTGHSSTSISAALGFAVARDLKKENHRVIALLGDGSMTGGTAFEALNNAGHLNTDLLVILNDNEMFISHRIGAVASFLARILTLGLVKRFEKTIENKLRRIHYVGMYLLKIAKRFKLLFFPGMLFEEMGFAYLGPVDGHDFKSLVEILNNIKQIKGPMVLHVLTKKGKGYEPAEKNPVKFHGAGKFEIETGEDQSGEKTGADIPTYTSVFGGALAELARQDERIVAITAAMSEGTGLAVFEKEFPDRFFDVGIAEGHALTFAAGLAAGGFKPVFAIYSTFLQRGFDQLIHDIALQKLPVILAIDRAGIVGEDGKTHQGVFDLSYLRMIPNLVVMAPKDENELRNMLFTAVNLNKPVALRYPRSKGTGVKIDSALSVLEEGKAEVLSEGKQCNILAIGTTVKIALDAASLLKNMNISCGVVNMRFVKPLDTVLLKQISGKCKNLVTVEENVVAGGCGSAVREAIDDPDIRVLNIGIPDIFIEHGTQSQLRNKYGLNAEAVADKIKKFVLK